MSWYEEATKAIVALINAAIEERGDMPEPKEITDIIAKHDPNRWVPVEERMPPTGLDPKSRTIHDDFRKVDVRFSNGRVEAMSAIETRDWTSGSRMTVTHWREIVPPEVKG